MREKVLLNERYCAVEIDKDGKISGYNKNAQTVFSDLLNLKKTEDLKGASIFKFSGLPETNPYDSTVPEKIISSMDNLTLVDSVFYKKTGSVIVRFVRDNQVFSSFFNLVKISSSLYLELDSEFNIIFGSELFLETAGAEKSETYGASISVFTDKKNRAKISSAADLCKKNSGCVKTGEIQFNFNGVIFSYDLEVSAVNDRNGVFSGIICHCSDRSIEKKCKMMSRTIRRMSAVANFAGGIAHDYNNALTAVLGNISLAKMDAGKNSELEELLQDAESAAMKIKNLTERLGMFARGMKPSREKTDIKKLIENSIPEMLCRYKGHLTVSIQDNMTCPEIDPVLISEAIGHVVENAVDAVDNPDGRIDVEVEEAEINKQLIFRETSLVSGRYIIISVKDNGSGFEPLTSSEIFDPYVTAKDGREGLGLALAYTILKRHRGFISVENPEGGGTLFKIYLPLFQ